MAIKKKVIAAKKPAVKEPEEVKAVPKKTAKTVVNKKTVPTTVSKKKEVKSITKKTIDEEKANSFEVREGSQATQEAFIDKYYKKLQALGYDITKEQAKLLKKAYSETLKEITDVASYKDLEANIMYARRFIKTRITEPPRARDGLKTIMLGHYELKVRKTLGDVEDYKFFGDLDEDGNFVTTSGDVIDLSEIYESEEKPKKTNLKPLKKVKKVVEEPEDEEDDDIIEGELEEEDDEEEIVEIEEESEDDEEIIEEEEKEEDFDDFLEDDDE